MFHVETDAGDLGWRRVPFVESRSKIYCEGYVDAMDSLYPSKPYRIVKVENDGTIKVVRETKGRASVHVN